MVIVIQYYYMTIASNVSGKKINENGNNDQILTSHQYIVFNRILDRENLMLNGNILVKIYIMLYNIQKLR